MEKLLLLNNLDSLREGAASFVKHPDGYTLARFDGSSQVPAPLESPARIVGLTVVLVKEGDIAGSLDGKPFNLHSRSLINFNHNNIVTITHWQAASALLLWLPPELIRDLNLDTSALNLRQLVENPPAPWFESLAAEEAECIEGYWALLYRNAVDNNETAFSKNIARSLVQAFLYQLLQFNSTRLGSASLASGAQQKPSAYVQEFMRLLQLHHSRHRSIAFYAGKLYISSKYLSHLIKEATGRSATDWIAQFVIMDAKNMLRFSNKNVQQVAYELNFSTQSSFGKYFKHITGMSPTEFQKT